MIIQGSRPPKKPSKVLLKNATFPNFLPTNAAKVSPRLIKTSERIAIFFGNNEIVNKEAIITQVAPVSLPFIS